MAQNAKPDPRLKYNALEGLQQLWYDQNGDVTITTGGKTFKAHKLVLQLQPGYFRTALQPDKFKEGESNVIKVDSGDSEVLEGVLRYLYNLPYTGTTTAPATAALEHARMYAAADYFNYPKLKDNARMLLSDVLKEDIGAAVYLKIIKIVCESTPDTDKAIRTEVLRRFQRYSTPILAKKELYEELEAISGATQGLLKMAYSTKQSVVTFECRDCGADLALMREPRHIFGQLSRTCPFCENRSLEQQDSQ